MNIILFVNVTAHAQKSVLQRGAYLQQEKVSGSTIQLDVESPTLLPKKMSYFYGFERRFTVSIMFVFLLGWLLYLIGLIVGGVSYTMPDAYIIKLDLIPRILFVLCGLILFSLKSRKASSVFGSISAFVTVLSCTFVSWLCSSRSTIFSSFSNLQLDWWWYLCSLLVY